METKNHDNNRNCLFRINTKPEKLIDLLFLPSDTFYEILLHTTRSRWAYQWNKNK